MKSTKKFKKFEFPALFDMLAQSNFGAKIQISDKLIHKQFKKW